MNHLFIIICIILSYRMFHCSLHSAIMLLLRNIDSENKASRNSLYGMVGAEILSNNECIDESSQRKFCVRYGDLFKQYKVPLSRMLHDMLEDNHLKGHQSN